MPYEGDPNKFSADLARNTVDDDLKVLTPRERALQRIEHDIVGILDEYLPKSEYMSTATDPRTGEVFDVVDVETAKDRIQTELRIGGVRVGQMKLIDAMFDRHIDDMVLTREQVERGDYEPKPLFYYPASLEAATTSIEIADAEFHLPIWEINGKQNFGSREKLFPVQEGESPTVFEARSALLLFHPRYGDGRRNREGRLMIKNPTYDPAEKNSVRRLPFGRDIVKKYGLIQVLQRDGKNTRTLREGMAAELPHLLENGELKLDDIRGVATERTEVSEYDTKTIGSKYVMFGSVNHYVGGGFKGCEASPFTDDKAVITNDDILVGAFNLVHKSETDRRYEGENGQGMAWANVADTKPMFIDYNKLVPNNKEGLQQELRPEKIRELQKLVTDRFESLADMADRAEDLVRSESPNLEEEKVKELTQKVRGVLQNQAMKVVEIAADAEDGESLRQSLIASTYDSRAFEAIIRSLGVERMLSNPLREVTTSELTPTEKGLMVKLLRSNYESSYPGDEYKEFREKIEESLHRSFIDSNTHFYLLEDGDEIVSFNRFDAVDDGRQLLYFGSFNADPEYRGVGSTMLEYTIEDRLDNCEAMFAHCDPRMPISQKYIEDGFVAVQTETVAGNFSFEIWRTADIKTQLQTKQMSIEELVSLAGQSAGVASDYFVREVTSDDGFDELDSGLSYLLTRYFTHDGKTYAAFELNPKLSHEFELQATSAQEAA